MGCSSSQENEKQNSNSKETNEKKFKDFEEYKSKNKIIY